MKMIHRVIGEHHDEILDVSCRSRPGSTVVEPSRGRSNARATDDSQYGAYKSLQIARKKERNFNNRTPRRMLNEFRHGQ